MQFKSTQKIPGKFSIRILAIACMLMLFSTARSQVLFNEGFSVAAPLPAGWASQNLSSPVGLTGWFQGNPAVWPANSGATNSYIGANFNNTTGDNIISNWLFTPSVTLKDGDIFTFYARANGDFADRLQVRMSTSGTSVNAGASSTSVGDFTTLLLDINPTYNLSSFPTTWTQFTVTISGLGGVPTPGRLAFRYFVESGGPTGANSDYMGIDDVVYTSFSGPCAGAPAPGNTVSSSPGVCPATNFTLSASFVPTVSGLTYQWQSSATGAAGTFSNITGATNSTLTTQQNAATFYQVVVSCGANSGTSTPLQVTMNPPTSCYCLAGANNLGFEKISNVTLNTINNTSSSTAGYENFTAVTTTLEPGRPYPMSVSISNAFAPDQVIVWIDYNQNGSFTDAGEMVYTSALGLGPHTTTLIVPFSALPGNTRMRVRMHDTSFGANSTPCGNSEYGQVEDYTINILPVVPCSGTPAPGNTFSSVTTVCSGTSFLLTLQNFTSGSGLTYQWQSSSTGAAGSFTDITGATGVQYSATQTAATYYQAVVSCGANSGTSTPVQVNLNPFTDCYCASVATSNADEDIFNVTLGTLNNTSNCTSVGPGPGSILRRYSNYKSGTGAPAAPELVRGATMPFSVTIGTCGGNWTNSVAAWIDFNQDGVFGATERVYVSAGGTTGPHTETGNILIPANAVLGVTGMRVINVETGTPNTIQPCATYAWGETEDYLVNIVPCVPGAITSSPANTTIGCSGNASFTAAASGSQITYQWEYRVNATSLWQFVPNQAPYSGLGTGTLTINNAPSSMNGYQYRAIISGPCTAFDPTGIATLTVGPLVATVTPVSANLCAGTIQQLTITNTAPPTTTQFCSGNINIQIPDVLGPPASPAAVVNAGINHTIPVTIPAGALISSMNVRFNITHTYNGDLVIVLKAPNGNILNLDYHKSGTGTAGANFTNTVISSTGTAAISSGASPYTGVFRADAVTGAGSQGDPSGTGPTGFAPNVTTWNQLYSIPSGDWTIAVVDPSNWAGDIGTLNNWCIEFSYGAPATGIFAGGPGIFTDAAGTIAYDGTTPITSVYVNPAVTTNYTVVVSNPLCTSAPTTIPVTVNNPISGASVNATDNVCVGGARSITASVTAGNIAATRWEVSTNGGTTWTTVTNGGAYSGATTPTLNISGASATLNGNQYRAIVSNVCNADTTNADVLTVNPNPVVTLSATPYTNLLPNLSTTINVSSSTTPVTYEWMVDGNVFTNTGSSFPVNVDNLGAYSVKVTDVNGCVGTSNTLNISDSSSAIVFIYPSPNTGQFQVRYYSDAGSTIPRMLNVFDSKGARVYSRSYSISAPYERMDVDLRGYGKGIYMVELTDRNGKRIKAGRVVVL